MRHSPQFDELAAGLDERDASKAMFPPLIVRTDRLRPSDWQTNYLMQLRQRRIAMRNIVMTPDVLDKLDSLLPVCPSL